LQAVSQGSPEDGLTQVGTQDLSTDPGYYSQSPSQLQYNRPVSINPSGGSTQQTTPQTPNTPSSIPDIILTGIFAGKYLQAKLNLLRTYENFTNLLYSQVYDPIS
jgi:hypothetical protein